MCRGGTKVRAHVWIFNTSIFHMPFLLPKNYLCM
jgi:hypothetical protein